jgi:uncharacterized OB-fold protein
MTGALPLHLRPPLHGSAAGFFRAAAQGELHLPRCRDCAAYAWPPTRRCRACGSDAIDWVLARGRGVVHTFTIVRQSPEPFFQARVPYVVAMIDLDEGPRLLSGLVDCDVGAVRIGMAVAVAFVEAGEGLALPVFRPVGVAADRAGDRTRG